MSKTIFSYDTETTGLPNWKVPSDDPSQPHIVQLGGILADVETRKQIASINVIIKPDGWEIPEEVSAIHGITTEYALEYGIPEKQAVEMLLALRGEAERVAYNKTFDQRIVRMALKRYFSEDAMNKWAIKEDHICSMAMAQKVLGKRPKLVEAYKYFMGRELVDAHSALADAQASLDVYFAILDLESDQAA